jgi:hypothetical protein
LAAVLFLALGLVLGLAVLGFTRGVIPDLILGSARRWFGLGRYLLPLALFGSGWLLLLWRNGRGAPFSVGRVVLVELGLLCLLGALSAFSGETVLEIEAGTSLGGQHRLGSGASLIQAVGLIRRRLALRAAQSALPALRF